MHCIVIILSLIILSSINTTISKTAFTQNDNTEDEMREIQPSYVTAVSSSLSPTVSSTLERNYLVKSELVQNLLHG